MLNLTCAKPAAPLLSPFAVTSFAPGAFQQFTATA